MPMYMDIHEVKGATAEDLAKAHAADVHVQGKHGVEYHKYWFNEAQGKIFCLCSAPSPEAAARCIARRTDWRRRRSSRSRRKSRTGSWAGAK